MEVLLTFRVKFFLGNKKYVFILLKYKSNFYSKC